MRRVSGIDPSLTSTGVAVVTATADSGGSTHQLVAGRVFLTTGVVKADVKQVGGEHPAVYEVQRVESIVEQVCRSVAGSEIVYVESPALMSRTGKALERGHLYFALLAALGARRIPFGTIAPLRLKKRVTGNGRAAKEEMLAAIRHAWSANGWCDGAVGGRFDRADAAGLAWMAALDQGFDVPEPGSNTGSCAA